MMLRVEKSSPSGKIAIPGSKSHTIRALAIGSMSAGTSRIRTPLASADTEACMTAGRALGAVIRDDGAEWIVTGCGGRPVKTGNVIDIGNSGTTLRLMSAMAALGPHETRFDGDHQIRTRPMQPLLDALNNLGADCSSLGKTGSCPINIKGPFKGGTTTVDGQTSQFLSALLLAAPLAEGHTGLDVPFLNEKPYADITLWWLDTLGIPYTATPDYTRFDLTGGRQYQAFDLTIPGDYSSATFPAVAAAVLGTEIELTNLVADDPQGDKEVLKVLGAMGAQVTPTDTGCIVKGSGLAGREIDLNATPDALPAMAVAGCLAEGTTVLKNVAQARIKETDRIKVMTSELRKMGADIEELPDGMVIRSSKLHGASVDGWADHRIVMALSLAGMAAEGTTTISGAEAIRITFPSYIEDMRKIGARFSS